MDITYDKEGIVTINPTAGGQLTFEDPSGEVLEINLNLKNGTFQLVPKITDTLNTRIAKYTVEMDEDMEAAVAQMFFLHAARIMRDSVDENNEPVFPEFQGLTLRQ